MSEETKQLEAGPELDRLVAEKMGYPVRLGEDGRTFGIYVVYSDSKPHFLPIPGFSTEIDMAWRVIDFVLSKGYDYEVGNTSQTEHYAKFSYMKVVAPTVPHAICLAFMELELE
jgi:hypothetical protein